MSDNMESYNLEVKTKVSDEFSRINILVVEDDLINQKIIKNILEKDNCKVLMVSNGRKALEFLRMYTVDLVLMDIYMPEINGIEVARKIREEELTTERYTPIIALASATKDEDKDKCLEAGMDGYITKPFREEIVYETITMVLKKKSKITGLNLEQILDALNGDRDILKELIEIVISDEYEKDYIESIGVFIENRNFELLSKKVHKFKGSVSVFGAEIIIDILNKMEDNIKIKDLNSLRDLFDELKNEFHRIKRILINVINKFTFEEVRE